MLCGIYNERDVNYFVNSIYNGRNTIDSIYNVRNFIKTYKSMETLMWLALAGVTIVVGKWIGKKIWPEDWEEFDNRHK